MSQLVGGSARNGRRFPPGASRKSRKRTRAKRPRAHDCMSTAIAVRSRDTCGASARGLTPSAFARAPSLRAQDESAARARAAAFVPQRGGRAGRCRPSPVPLWAGLQGSAPSGSSQADAGCPFTLTFAPLSSALVFLWPPRYSCISVKTISICMYMTDLTQDLSVQTVTLADDWPP